MTAAPGIPPDARARAGRLEGRQRWSDLLFLHWALEPAEVRRAVPPELPLDLRDGKAWVGVVAFDIPSARLPLFPRALGLRFLETNARTYVRLPGDEPAVYFFSLEAASRWAVLAARARYALPYHHARMSLERRPGEVAYCTARRTPGAPGLAVTYRVGADRGPAAPGSLDEFLIERYALHTVRSGTVRTVRVRHVPYPLRHAEAELHGETLLAAAGVRRPPGAPLVHFSPGVDVAVYAG